jgi:hypothetical protein
MLFGETVAVYCENHMEHTDTLCGQNVEFYYVQVGGTYSDHGGLKGLPSYRWTFITVTAVRGVVMPATEEAVRFLSPSTLRTMLRHTVSRQSYGRKVLCKYEYV